MLAPAAPSAADIVYSGIGARRRHGSSMLDRDSEILRGSILA
jgi:hypothetical protein